MAGSSAGKSKKGRKIGRNAKKCERYFKEGRREKNKKRKAEKLKKHLLKAKARRENKHRGTK